MIVQFPTPSRGYDSGLIATCFNVVRLALLRAVARDEAIDGLILRSPNGTNYRLTVTDAGSLTTTPV